MTTADGQPLTAEDRSAIADLKAEHDRFAAALTQAPTDLPYEWERKVGATLRELREERGWSQSQAVSRLARMWNIEIHQTTLAKLEAGRRPIRLAELFALATLYGHSLLDVLTMESAASGLDGEADMNAEIARLSEGVEEVTADAVQFLKSTIKQLGAMHGRADSLRGLRREQARRSSTREDG